MGTDAIVVLGLWPSAGKTTDARAVTEVRQPQPLSAKRRLRQLAGSGSANEGLDHATSKAAHPNAGNFFNAMNAPDSRRSDRWRHVLVHWRLSVKTTSVASPIRCRRLRAAIGAQRKAHRAANTERIGKQ